MTLVYTDGTARQFQYHNMLSEQKVFAANVYSATE